MSGHLLRAGLRTIKLPQRLFSVSSVYAKPEITLTQQQRDEYHPMIGNREIVGYGMNGFEIYMDSCEYPCPAIRFKEDTPELLKLKEKEKKDFKSLTIDEKKELYRASFCQTYKEIEAPNGDYLTILTGIFIAVSGAFLVCWYLKKFVLPPLPESCSYESRKQEVMDMVARRSGHLKGVASKWDYEKNEWKETRYE